MITINNYFVCRITKRAIIVYALPDAPEKLIERQFATEDEATERISNEQQGALHHAFHDWIGHKKHIANHSTWYDEQTKRDSLKMLLRIADDMIQWDLFHSCSELMNVKQQLYAILPSPGNSSYVGSRAKLAEMLSFCEERLKKFKLSKVS